MVKVHEVALLEEIQKGCAFIRVVGSDHHERDISIADFGAAVDCDQLQVDVCPRADYPKHQHAKGTSQESAGECLSDHAKTPKRCQQVQTISRLMPAKKRRTFPNVPFLLADVDGPAGGVCLVVAGDRDPSRGNKLMVVESVVGVTPW